LSFPPLIIGMKVGERMDEKEQFVELPSVNTGGGRGNNNGLVINPPLVVVMLGRCCGKGTTSLSLIGGGAT
jgi:hypothetical protein